MNEIPVVPLFTFFSYFAIYIIKEMFQNSLVFHFSFPTFMGYRYNENKIFLKPVLEYERKIQSPEFHITFHLNKRKIIN